MKNVFTMLALLLTFASCVKKDAVTIDPVTKVEDPDWIKLEIPTGREAYAIAGDIDKTLLVTTWTKAYYTSDQGKTWIISKNFDGPIPGLFVRNDTTFALHTRRFDGQSGALLGAWDALYFSPDYGKTWGYYLSHYKEYLDVVEPIGAVKSASGTKYFILPHLTPTAPGSATSYINPAEIVRNDGTVEQVVGFPFKHNLINLYLDPHNRLYVAASGGTYQPESNTFFCCEVDMPAIVYVSRRPLP